MERITSPFEWAQAAMNTEGRPPSPAVVHVDRSTTPHGPALAVDNGPVPLGGLRGLAARDQVEAMLSHLAGGVAEGDSE